jgi:hypothetical protein
LEGIQELDAIEECQSLEEDERVRKIDMSREREKSSFWGIELETEI